MRKKTFAPDERQGEMFPDLPSGPPRRKGSFKGIPQPVWTKNKAKLVSRYLYYFVLITKHGTYIDGFAGPQNPSRPSTWAANLVCKSKPRWLRTIFLFDIDKRKVDCLRRLKDEQLRVDPRRRVIVQRGDFNKKIKRLLQSKPIKPRQATFCLLDQRTFECNWETVVRLAKYKGGDYNKIELFYFLAVGWLHRSAKGIKKHFEKPEGWWGGRGWEGVLQMNVDQIRDHFVERFENLGYRFVTPWPIFSRQRGGRIMYYMIHASDHPEAPKQMQRAYHGILKRKESLRQIAMEFGIPEARLLTEDWFRA